MIDLKILQCYDTHTSAANRCAVQSVVVVVHRCRKRTLCRRVATTKHPGDNGLTENRVWPRDKKILIFF